MRWQNKEELKDLAFELVAQNSISGTANEIDMSKLVYNKLSTLDYYKKNPDHLRLVEVGDSIGRYFVCALMKSNKNNPKTLLTVAHTDTVGIDDAGALKEYIFKPYEYTQKLRENLEMLDPDSKKDLLSGEWLFGRGIMDMKTGLAIQMSLIEYLSKKEDFDGNIMVLAVPDEETNSEGALAAVSYANKFLKEEKLNPIAVLNCEPDFASYPGDDNKYVYLGTCGKLLPGMYVVGKEAHVGECLAGINTNLISSEIISRLEINTDFCEVVDGDVTMPPTCLKYKDLKDLYNVQTPISSIMYYNIQTFKSNPKEVLDKLRKICEEAAQSAENKVQKNIEAYKRLSNLPTKDNDFKIRVISYEELYNEVIAKFDKKEVDDKLDKEIRRLLDDKSLDERDISLNIVRYLHNILGDNNPCIVLFFAPPYYPHVGLDESREFDSKLINLANSIVKKGKSEYQEEIKIQKYFQGLSDLSYFALQDADLVMKFLKTNMPSLGYRYDIPLDDIRELDLPVINLGPHGRDPHKYTERILVDYSYETVPKLIRELVEGIFKL